jgi:hypothetical protein
VLSVHAVSAASQYEALPFDNTSTHMTFHSSVYRMRTRGPADGCVCGVPYEIAPSQVVTDIKALQNDVLSGAGIDCNGNSSPSSCRYVLRCT